MKNRKMVKTNLVVLGAEECYIPPMINGDYPMTTDSAEDIFVKMDWRNQEDYYNGDNIISVSLSLKDDTRIAVDWNAKTGKIQSYSKTVLFHHGLYYGIESLIQEFKSVRGIEFSKAANRPKAVAVLDDDPITQAAYINEDGVVIEESQIFEVTSGFEEQTPYNPVSTPKSIKKTGKKYKRRGQDDAPYNQQIALYFRKDGTPVKAHRKRQPIRKTVYSQEERSKALILLKKGEAVRKIADACNVPVSTLYNWRRRFA